jgi:phage terminase large subunit-like protein
MSHGSRLVLVVEAPAVDDGDPLGEVTVAGVDWKDVSAFFADSPEARPSASAAAKAVAGLDLDAAWDTGEAQALMTEHDLLWYGPEEVDVFLSTWSLVFFD